MLLDLLQERVLILQILVQGLNLRLHMTQFTRRLIDAACLLYTSDAADERSSVDLGGRRIIKKKKYGTINCDAEHS